MLLNVKEKHTEGDLGCAIGVYVGKLTPLIQLMNYPELQKIARRCGVINSTVNRKLAYQLYESKWNFVDKENLEEGEKELLQGLIISEGIGIFTPEPMFFSEIQ